MSNEIRYPYASGKTLYAVALNSSGYAWNTSTGAFEAVAAADWTLYAIGLAEQASCGVYLGSFPSAVTASGLYTVMIYARSGSDAAPADTVAGVGQVAWNGSQEISTLDTATILKADSRFKTLLAYVDCNYSYNPNTGVLTLYDTDGATVLMTIQLTFDPAGDITSRAVTAG